MPPTTVNRLLRSSLLEALAYPHGVDRYVELVRPLLVAREVRAEITAVRHQTPRSVTLTLRPNANWRGMSAGQFVNLSVEIDGVRETRPYSPAGSEHAADGTLELTVSTHPDGRVSRHLRDHARPGMIVGLSEAQGEFVLPRGRPTAGAADQRRQRHHAGDGDAAHPLRRGPGGQRRGWLPQLRAVPRAGALRRELDELVERHPRLRVARGFTRGAASLRESGEAGASTGSRSADASGASTYSR